MQNISHEDIGIAHITSELKIVEDYFLMAGEERFL